MSNFHPLELQMGENLNFKRSALMITPVLIQYRLRRRTNIKTTLSDTWDKVSRIVLSETVDCCIRFTRKINIFQHSGDRERYRPQGPKNIYNFLMTVWKIS